GAGARRGHDRRSARRADARAEVHRARRRPQRRGGPGVAAHVLRLRVAMLLGALRGDIESVTRTIAWLILVVGSTALVCWGLLTLADAGTDVALTVTVLGGSAVTAGFAIAPIVGG